MAIFVERNDAKLREAVDRALRADPTAADDASVVEGRVAEVKEAAKKTGDIHWGRVLVGVAIAAALIVAAIVLAVLADNFAVEQAARAAENTDYEAPSSELPEIATAVMALATAWSGALVGTLFAEATG